MNHVLQTTSRADYFSGLLDTQQLQRDMNGPEIAQHIQQSNTLAEAMGLVGTPTFIAGSDSRFGAISSSELAELVAASRRN